MAFKIGEAAKRAAYGRIQAERMARRQRLIERTREKAEAEGTDSIWAEMLAELEAV